MDESRLVNEVTRAINSTCSPEYHVKFKLNETTGDYEFEDPSDVNYTSICYLIALNIACKAQKLQLDNDVTGFQHGYIAKLATELINGRVLTPIEDKDDEWCCIDDCYGHKTDGTGEHVYQSKRYPALFKNVSATGDIGYTDMHRFAYREGACCLEGGCINKIGERMCGPISLPYMPKESIVFDAFTFDSAAATPGDYDTMCIYNAKDSALFFDDDGNELAKDEFLARYEQYCRIAHDNGYEVKELDKTRIN